MQVIGVNARIDEDRGQLLLELMAYGILQDLGHSFSAPASNSRL